MTFGIYLTGHDAVADLHLGFSEGDGGTYTIEFSGRIALIYSGDEHFRHAFKLKANIPDLEKISFVQKDRSDEEVREAFAKVVGDADAWEMTERKGESRHRNFVRRV